jgi:hypothetical protein
LVKENEEVLTATTSAGDTSFMVCKTNQENKNQKVCVDLNNPPEGKPENRRQMLDNNTYDLMEQLLIENKSLWRIKNNYKSDATDNETRQLWNAIEKDKEELVGMLQEKLKERL